MQGQGLFVARKGLEFGQSLYFIYGFYATNDLEYKNQDQILLPILYLTTNLCLCVFGQPTKRIAKVITQIYKTTLQQNNSLLNSTHSNQFNFLYQLKIHMNEELNNQYVEYFKEVFKNFDQDDSKKITKEELRLLMGALGQNLSQTKIDQLINQIDGDGDGVVDDQQFLHLMQIIMKRSDPQQQCGKAFRIFDRDGNGTISPAQLKQVMINLDRPMTATELEEIYRVIGRQGKQEIDQQDFIKLMMQRKQHDQQ